MTPYIHLQRILSFCYAAGLCARLYGQEPDAEVKSFFPKGGIRGLENSQPAIASMKVYSDGEFLLIYIDVRDARLTLSPSLNTSDHVELSVALPPSAFPEDFAYAHHPSYLLLPGQQVRLLSAQPDYQGRLDLREPEVGGDYPTPEQIQRDRLDLPPASQLRRGRADAGILRYAFFPDGRPPVLMNRSAQSPVEQSLTTRMGKVQDGVKYLAEPHEHGDGYSLSIQLSPQGLGYVQLPHMHEVSLLAEIADCPAPGRPFELIAASSPQAESERPATFSLFRLREGIRTNFSPLPDETYWKLGFRPLFFWGETGWTPLGVDVDELYYGIRQASRRLTEVKFYLQIISYEELNIAGAKVDHLTTDLHFVNEVSKERDYWGMYDQTIVAERVKYLQTAPEGFQSNLFQFADGVPGLILRSNTPIHPFGWGDCPNCVLETFTIYRIQPGSKQEVLVFEQGDGPNAFFQLGNISLSDYYVRQIEWLKQGQSLQLRLQHRYQEDSKRIRITWKRDGSDVQAILIN
jgi:hypothetical protein